MMILKKVLPNGDRRRTSAGRVVECVEDGSQDNDVQTRAGLRRLPHNPVIGLNQRGFL